MISFFSVAVSAWRVPRDLGYCCMSPDGVTRYFRRAHRREALRSATAPRYLRRSCRRNDDATVDQNTYLVGRNAFYQSLPAQYVQNKRLEDQANLLEAYEKDPATFLKRYKGLERIFLFDAVIDAKNMVRVGTFA